MTTPMDDDRRRRDLADFLRTRRARLSPADVGLTPGPRRRTPGLRREEVALLAHLGTAWYTELEQGRDIRPSRGVLDNLADALRLSPTERRHLFLLADQPLPAPMRTPPCAEAVPPALRRVIDRQGDGPAYVMGRRWDLLAWNRAADVVLGFSAARAPHTRNLVWRLFTDPARRSFYVDWDTLGQGIVAQFRADSARYPGDPWFAALIEDLRAASPEFRAWWPRHDVWSGLDGRKELEHPGVGRLALEYISLHAPATPDLKVIIYTPLPEAETAAKLGRLLNGATGAENDEGPLPPACQSGGAGASNWSTRSAPSQSS